MTDPMAMRPKLSLEGLEARDIPSAGQWLVEPFQRGPSSGLPQGWGQWSNDGSRGFQVESTAAGLGDTGRLTTSGLSGTASRAWVSTQYDADVETSASVFLNSSSPIQLLIRGQNLNGTVPSYYAASVVRGGNLQLVKVDRGQTTVLGTVSSGEWISNRWVQVTIRADGDAIQVQLSRGDTNQSLGPDGKWSRRSVAAIRVHDAALKQAGQVGFARGARTADDVSVDSLRVGPANPPTRTTLYEDRFAGGPATGLPQGWGIWTATPGQITARTVADETLRIDGPSTGATRGWLNRVIPGDVQVSSSIYVDSLIPAGLIARGVNLHSDTPTYYGVAVKRGLQVDLVRVLNGRETVIGSIRSRDYVSGLWVQSSLIVKGSELRVQIFRSDTGQYLHSDGTWGLSPQWAISRKDTAIASGERVGLSRGTGSSGELVFDNFLATASPNRLISAETIPTQQDKPNVPTVPTPEDNPPPPPAGGGTPTSPPTVPPTPTPTPATNPALPNVPRHYSHIRIAQLAYHGTPFGEFEKSLLRNSVDLVIPNQAYLDTIQSVAPNTPQFVYTNLTNIYLGLYTDWLQYAERNNLNREDAFYHVSKASSFIGLSASAVPVDRFWAVFSGNASNAWTNITSAARNSDTTFSIGGKVNESVAFGYPEKFRELNLNLQSGASGGWAGQYEYVKSVDSQGRPTSWGRLNTLSNTTNNFRNDGRVTFDPPADWVASSVDGGARYFYVRARTTTAGTAPQLQTASGNDYTNFRGAQLGGTTPAFDATADRDRDGYLNDREYATRRAGSDARFLYQSRLFYPTYGPMRFAANVSSTAYQAWAADYHLRYLQTQPNANGFFVDNSTGKIAVDPTTLRESLATYAVDYGALLGTVNRRIAPRWLVANTAGAGASGEPIARNGITTLEEFGLRPLSTNHVQLDDLVATLAYRRQLSGGKAYEILDSLPQGKDATDPRVQLTTLAMYYLVADPNLSFLMMNGGNEPASSWSRHWTDAITYNVGKPVAALAQFATGLDPSNRALTYKVFRREYQNAIVFYKPLSYTRGTAGTIADNTATTHQLDGTYRPLKADGSLGAPVNRITIRNGEGITLVKSR